MFARCFSNIKFCFVFATENVSKRWSDILTPMDSKGAQVVTVSSGKPQQSSMPKSFPENLWKNLPLPTHPYPLNTSMSKDSHFLRPVVPIGFGHCVSISQTPTPFETQILELGWSVRNHFSASHAECRLWLSNLFHLFWHIHSIPCELVLRNDK